MKCLNSIWLVFIILFLLVTCASKAAPQRPHTPTAQPILVPDKNPCVFNNKLPNDFSLFAAGGYAGRKLAFQIDSSGHQATQMDIAVNHTRKPVVLMLGAYEPTIWNISWTPETKIIAVMLSGYHKQVISGITAEMDVLISTDENREKCGIFYIDPHRLSSLNPIARRLFQHQVDMVYLAENGKVVVGEALPVNAKLKQSPLIKPEHYRKNKLSGIPGLEQAVSSGELRKATLDDAHAWVDSISKEFPPEDIPPVAGQGVIKPRRPLLMNAYVVLKPFTYPEGLTGRNSAVFFIPKGVPNPNGNHGNSTVYDFNTLSCTGSFCR